MIYPTRLEYSQFGTQKVRGLAWLARSGNICGFEGPGYLSRMGAETGGSRLIRVWPYDEPPAYPFFARPCPEAPRHGFVESRSVANPTDLMRLIMQTYAEDPKAEIIFMPRLTGLYSAVATPNMVTIGKKNDGVTAGNGVLVQLSAPTPSLPIWNHNFSGMTSYKNEEVIYIEAVENAGRMVTVQARPGPLVDSMVDFVPKDLTVTGVWLLGGGELPNLLTWEKWVKEWKEIPGFVVHAPGSSLASHYAVHCIQNGVPFLTRKGAPKVGDLLRKEAPIKVTGWGRKRFKDEMQARMAERRYHDAPQGTREQANNAGFAISVAHAHSLWGNDVVSAKLRARGLIYLLRFTAIACVGEARHFYMCGPGRPLCDQDYIDFYALENKYVASAKAALSDWPQDEQKADIINTAREMGLAAVEEYKKRRSRSPLLPWESECHPYKMPLEPEKPKRQDVYKNLFHKDLETLMGYLPAAIVDLQQPGWFRRMGGDKWAAAASSALATWEALRVFLGEPSSTNWRRLCEKWNLLAFSVHNGGKILNKWCDADKYAELPAAGLASNALLVVEELGEPVQHSEELTETGAAEVEEVEAEEVAVEGQAPEVVAIVEEAFAAKAVEVPMDPQPMVKAPGDFTSSKVLYKEELFEKLYGKELPASATEMDVFWPDKFTTSALQEKKE